MGQLSPAPSVDTLSVGVSRAPLASQSNACPQGAAHRALARTVGATPRAGGWAPYPTRMAQTPALRGATQLEHDSARAAPKATDEACQPSIPCGVSSASARG